MQLLLVWVYPSDRSLRSNSIESESPAFYGDSQDYSTTFTKTLGKGTCVYTKILIFSVLNDTKFAMYIPLVYGDSIK